MSPQSRNSRFPACSFPLSACASSCTAKKLPTQDQANQHVRIHAYINNQLAMHQSYFPPTSTSGNTPGKRFWGYVKNVTMLTGGSVPWKGRCACGALALQ